jgi:hypothetical protein
MDPRIRIRTKFSWIRKTAHLYVGFFPMQTVTVAIYAQERWKLEQSLVERWRLEQREAAERWRADQRAHDKEMLAMFAQLVATSMQAVITASTSRSGANNS